VNAVPGVPQLLRVINDRAALDLLVRHGPLSRTSMAQLTGLSHPTATRLLARLEQSGLVVTAGFAEGGKGPNSLLYAINPKAAYFAALDVTPAGIEVAVADLTGDVVSRVTRGQPAPTRVRAAVSAAIKPLGIGLDGLAQVVIGTPGSVNPRTRTLEYAEHLPGWQEPDVVARLADALGVDVVVENDVNLAALAEHRIGAARDCSDFALFWMGEGLGLGVVMDGGVRRGATGGSGEISYLPGVPPSRLRPGDPGDFQSSAGEPALLELAGKHGVAGTTATAVLRAARRTPALFAEWAGRIAVGLAAVTCVLDPELIVLGGPIGTAAGSDLAEPLAERLAAITPHAPRIEVSSVPGNAVAAGALLTSLAAGRERLFNGTTSGR
jgi:predicted NBD/HSP70 family sugar kinase